MIVTILHPEHAITTLKWASCCKMAWPTFYTNDSCVQTLLPVMTVRGNESPGK